MATNNVLELVGNTPMVRVNHIDTGKCELYLKLESHNPGGSIKDRIALSMIEAAERDGSLKAGGTLVEATAGNTGLGLALVASQKGYKLILVIPDKMSQEKIFHLKALGAEVVMTRSDVGIGHPEYYQDMAKRIAKEGAGSMSISLKIRVTRSPMSAQQAQKFLSKWMKTSMPWSAVLVLVARSQV